MTQCFQKYNRLITGCVSAIAISTSIALSPSASAQLFNNAVDQLPVQERVALRSGRSLVTGNQGKYTGRILVTAPTATAWKVLTDYDNFERFLPNVASSQLLQKNGNQKVFEQVQVVKVFLITQKTRVRIAATETYPQQIAFKVVAGDLRSLNGVWRLEPVAPYQGAAPNQVLITHQVSIDPGSTPSRDLFFKIYKDNLQNSLAALKTEITRRSAGK